jgi:hypothetical protein
MMAPSLAIAQLLCRFAVAGLWRPGRGGRCDTAKLPGLALHFHHHSAYQRRQPMWQ